MPTVIDHPSPNFGPRRPAHARPLYLVAHYTGMDSAAAALKRLCDPAAQVSAHYLIDENGDTYRLVAEDQRAWHAGKAFWRGERDINSVSIGIELANPGHDYGYRAFPPAQMEAFIALTRGIMKRHGIAPAGALGHSDIAPGRKIDPGEKFDWAGLAAHGIGLWPGQTNVATPDTETAVAMLSAIGYAVPTSAALGADILNADHGARDVIAAFQRRYRQTLVDGVLDPETARRIAAIASQTALPQA